MSPCCGSFESLSGIYGSKKTPFDLLYVEKKDKAVFFLYVSTIPFPAFLLMNELLIYRIYKMGTQTCKKTIFFTQAWFEPKIFYPKKCVNYDKSN